MSIENTFYSLFKWPVSDYRKLKVSWLPFTFKGLKTHLNLPYISITVSPYIDFLTKKVSTIHFGYKIAKLAYLSNNKTPYNI